MIVELLIVAITVVICWAGWLARDRRPADPLELHQADSVLVTLKSGEAFTGALYEVGEKSLVLRGAVRVDDQERSQVTVDGELLVSRVDVAYMQFPT